MFLPHCSYKCYLSISMNSIEVQWSVVSVSVQWSIMKCVLNIRIELNSPFPKGSPFTVKVLGEGSNIQREFIKKQRESAPVADVGNECKLQFRLPGEFIISMRRTILNMLVICRLCNE